MARRLGFSLVELVLALALLAILLGLSTVSMRGREQSGTAQALAMEVAAELRAAQLKAKSLGAPVALVFPSQGGNRPHSRSAYILEGEGPPQHTRTRQFGSEYEKAYLFLGTWNVDPASLRDPSALPSIDESGGFSIQNWLGTPTQDYYFVFTPDGAVQSNDLPRFDGRYHIAVASGLSYTAMGSPLGGTASVTPGPNYYRLDTVATPYTVTLSREGGVSVSPGLAGASLPESGFSVATPPADPIPVPSLTNQNPTVHDVWVFPEPNTVTTGSNDALLGPDSHLLLRTHSTDPDGDRLLIEWTMTRVNGGDAGRFSQPSGGAPFRWDDRNREWVSHWTWKPPLDGVPGERFTGQLRVWDVNGAPATAGAGAVLNIELFDEGQIAYQDVSTGNSILYVAYPDGTGERAITDSTANSYDISFSRDGSRVAFSQDSAGGASHVWLANLDGSAAIQLVAEESIEPTFSPDGSQIVYVAQGQNTNRIITADGAWVRDMPPGWGVSWSPDGSRLVYSRGWPDAELYVCDADNPGSEVPLTTLSSAQAEMDADWHPDPLENKIIYRSNSNGGFQIYTYQVGAAAPEQRTTAGNHGVPRYSPDGTRVIYSKTVGGVHQLFVAEDTGTGPFVNERALNIVGEEAYWSP